MTYREFDIALKNRINTLSTNEQLELAISVCKKLFPDYQEFHFKHKWGNPNVLIDTIAICEKDDVHNLDISFLAELLKKVDEVIPDTEDFEDCSYALNAGSAVYETLQFLIDKKSSHIINASTCLTDTIDFKLQVDASLLEEEIDNEAKMIMARNFLLGKE